MLENTSAPDGRFVNGDGAWVIDGEVQIDNYDSDYPLKGMTREVHLETNGRYDFVESAVNGSTTAWAAYNDTGKREYLSFYVDRLSGKTQNFGELHQSYPEEANRYEATYQVLKSFLNSFDWRNASDKTKLEKAAGLVCQSNYLNEGTQLNHRPYGVFVEKKAVCEGFALSFFFLTRLMGLESAYIPNGNHAYNIVKIDGKWYQFDATNSLQENNSDFAILSPVEVLIINGNINVSGFKVSNSEAFMIYVR